MLKESSRSVTFDLAARAEYRDPERMERTVYISPLKFSTTADGLKKMFYSKKCGAIKSVTLENHRKRLSMAKAKYALVEFAHLDSVEVKRREERDSTPKWDSESWLYTLYQEFCWVDALLIASSAINHVENVLQGLLVGQLYTLSDELAILWLNYSPYFLASCYFIILPKGSHSHSRCSSCDGSVTL